jgi:hypothetical protein
MPGMPAVLCICRWDTTSVRYVNVNNTGHKPVRGLIILVRCNTCFSPSQFSSSDPDPIPSYRTQVPTYSYSPLSPTANWSIIKRGLGKTQGKRNRNRGGVPGKAGKPRSNGEPRDKGQLRPRAEGFLPGYRVQWEINIRNFLTNAVPRPRADRAQKQEARGDPKAKGMRCGKQPQPRRCALSLAWRSHQTPNEGGGGGVLLCAAWAMGVATQAGRGWLVNIFAGFLLALS